MKETSLFVATVRCGVANCIQCPVIVCSSTAFVNIPLQFALRTSFQSARIFISMFAFFVGNYGLLKGNSFTFQLNPCFPIGRQLNYPPFVKTILTP